MSKPETTSRTDIERMRIQGAWVLIPDGLCGRSLEKIAYFRKGNDKEYQMPLSQWGRLPFYEVKQ
jgi:hypothetical protein